MLRIRLQRLGKKNDPFYRVVILPKHKKRGAGALEIIGTWNPSLGELQLDKKRLKHWIGVGAIPTTTVDKLIKQGKL
jgi:small subunit ribosomal protein S16